MSLCHTPSAYNTRVLSPFRLLTKTACNLSHQSFLRSTAGCGAELTWCESTGFPAGKIFFACSVQQCTEPGTVCMVCFMYLGFVGFNFESTAWQRLEVWGETETEDMHQTMLGPGADPVTRVVGFAHRGLLLFKLSWTGAPDMVCMVLVITVEQTKLTVPDRKVPEETEGFFLEIDHLTFLLFGRRTRRGTPVKLDTGTKN